MLEGSRDQLIVALLFAGRHLLDAAIDGIALEGERPAAADVAVLLALQAFPSSSQTELTAILGRDKTTLSRTVSRLRKKGFVNARIDPIDGRRQTLELTEKAIALAVPALRSATDRMTDILSAMTPDEERACFRLMGVLLKDMVVV